ncbi:hypothetical protein V1525DRAFT_392221, partial [Lipomyces kononenkoae]
MTDSGFKQEARADDLEVVRSRAPSNLKHVLSIEKIKNKESNYKAYYKVVKTWYSADRSEKWCF